MLGALRGLGRYNEGQMYCTTEFCSGKGDVKASFERLQAVLGNFTKGVIVDGKITIANVNAINKIGAQYPKLFPPLPLDLVSTSQLAVELTQSLQAVLSASDGSVLAPSRASAAAAQPVIAPPPPVVSPPPPAVAPVAPPVVPGYAPPATITPDTPTEAIPIGPTVTLTPSTPSSSLPPTLAPVTTAPNVSEKIKSFAIAQKKRIIAGGIAIAALGILGASGATIYRKRKRASASV